MSSVQQLEEAGKQYNNLFVYYLIIICSSVLGGVPVLGILISIGCMVMMYFVFKTLRNLVGFSQDPDWLQTSGMARSLALLLLLSYPVNIIIQVYQTVDFIRVITMGPDLEQFNRPPIPQEQMAAYAVGAFFYLALMVVSIVFVYKLCGMSIWLGNNIQSKKLVSKAKHVKKCYTILLLSGLGAVILLVVFSVLMAAVAASAAGTADNAGAAALGLGGAFIVFFVLFLLVALGFLAFSIYIIVVFLIMLHTTSSELKNAAKQAAASAALQVVPPPQVDDPALSSSTPEGV